MKHWGGSGVDSTNLISYFALFEDSLIFMGSRQIPKKRTRFRIQRYLRTLSIAPVEERDHGTDGFGWTIIPTTTSSTVKVPCTLAISRAEVVIRMFRCEIS